MHNWSATAFYYNEFAQLIGHDAQQVNDWLDAHPDYDGYLWMNYGDGGEDVNVTDIFADALEKHRSIIQTEWDIRKMERQYTRERTAA